MKKLIIALSLLTFFASVPFAFAGGNHRFAIDQKWKQVEAWQKQQARQFKALEREAAKPSDGIADEPSYTRPRNVACPYCLHYCQVVR